MKVVGNMMDSECEIPQKTDDPKIIEKLQQNVNKTIEEEIKSAVEIDQKSFKADLFGFGDAYHRNNPKDWKVIQSKWMDIYPDIPIEVTVETEIHNAGSIILSPKAEVENK
ncbi:Ger(x)C family spore germination C-terminal domain-containing protein [Filobacillus milosensis]|uniref:Ger(x)C family spore germination C-terminal domain-containing protein n=1 Tax=Filobacillus milosensis TaxID=94137 RepID=UPI002263BF63|nr:Ger(x)C family spore germination C-terminal domain-containing protein [Filobacillus milosensis]